MLGFICVTAEHYDWSAAGRPPHQWSASINTNGFSGVGAPGECPFGPNFINNIFPLLSTNENSAKNMDWAWQIENNI